jgi:hypothetical protein
MVPLLRQLLRECADRHPDHRLTLKFYPGNNEVLISNVASLLDELNTNQLQGLFFKVFHEEDPWTGSLEALVQTLQKQQQLEVFMMKPLVQGSHDLRLLISYLVALPNLKKVELHWGDAWQFNDDDDEPADIDGQIQAATMLVQKVGLEAISLCDIPFAGNLQGIFQGVQNNPSLKQVSLRVLDPDCYQLEEEVEQYAETPQYNRDVAMMIRTNHCIEELTLSPITKGDCGPIFQALHNHSSLRTLDLSYDRLKSEQVELAAEMCRKNNSIKCLKLIVHCGSEVAHRKVVSIGPLAEAIGTDNSTLEELHFLREGWDFDTFSKQNAKDISRMLQNNTSIEVLEVPVAGDCLEPIVAALKVNHSLKDLVIASISSKQAKSLLGILEDHNFMLETLKTTSWTSREQRGLNRILRKINFYLTLNKVFHRKRLFSSDATTEEWVQVIISAKWSTDVIFYLLSKNLSLIAGANLNSPALMATGIGARYSFGSVPVLMGARCSFGSVNSSSDSEDSEKEGHETENGESEDGESGAGESEDGGSENGESEVSESEDSDSENGESEDCDREDRIKEDSIREDGDSENIEGDGGKRKDSEREEGSEREDREIEESNESSGRGGKRQRLGDGGG